MQFSTVHAQMNDPAPPETPEVHLEDEFRAESVLNTDRRGLMRMGIGLEGGLAVAAILISYLGFYDHGQDLSQLTWTIWREAIFIGLIGTLPMLIYLVVFHYWHPSFYKPMRDFVAKYLTPLFAKCTLLDLFVLSLLAGFGEELFFRWCIQGGIAWLIGGQTGIWIGLAIASLFFGICHWVNACYGISTAIIGVYLGLMMIWTGSFLSAAIAHALFDFVAFIYLTRWSVKPVTAEAKLQPGNGYE